MLYQILAIGVAPEAADGFQPFITNSELRSSEIVRIAPPANTAALTEIDLTLDGVDLPLDLQPTSVRTTDFELLVQEPSGMIQRVEPGPALNYSGTVRDIPGSAVAASAVDGRWFIRILLSDGETWWVEPVRGMVASANGDEHVAYSSSDILPSDMGCGAAGDPVSNPPIGCTAETETIPGVFIAELAIDTDYEFYTHFGSVDATRAAIETMINAVNIQYERDVGITHQISSMMIRTAPTDVYSASDADGLLGQLKEEWVVNPTPRDLVLLFTGKELDGNTIGIAWIGTTCSVDFGYSLVETVYSSLFGNKTDLIAHELGHNWGAHHCGDDGPGDPDPCDPECVNNTMNCWITGSNVFHPTRTIPVILGFRNAASCLTQDTVRRLTVRAPSDTVMEDQTLQLTAEATFSYSGVIDVSNDAIWTVDPPDAGSIDAAGLLTPNPVNHDICLTVTATYTVNQTTNLDQKTLRIDDVEQPRSIVASTPPAMAIDARQPTEPDRRVLQGWRDIELTFNGENCVLLPSDLSVTEIGGSSPPASIALIEDIDAATIHILLDAPIDLGAITIFRDQTANNIVWLASLPGDANGDGAADASDIQVLIEHLEGQTTLPGEWSTDIDRSGQTTPADLLRLIDVLQGAGTYEPWNGRFLPPAS